MTEIYWKELVTNPNKYEVKNIKKFKDLDEVEFQCQICGKPFMMRGRVFKRRFDSDGYFRRMIFACQSPECLHKKKSMVGHSEAVREGQAKGAVVAARLKKGKTFEEMYGKEEAEKKLAKIRDARATQTGTEHDPRLGKKHSDCAKKKMSASKIKLWNSEEQTYIGCIMRKPVNYREFQQQLSVAQWSAPQYGTYVTGTLINWNTGVKERYDSSFELAYMEELNEKKVFWKKNTSTAIPFIDIDQQEHLYIPDIIIYKDAKCTKISRILEIKPECMVHKMKTVQLKLQALKSYCEENNLECGIITEKQLNMNRVKEIQNEHKRNKKKKAE